MRRASRDMVDICLGRLAELGHRNHRRIYLAKALNLCIMISAGRSIKDIYAGTCCSNRDMPFELKPVLSAQ